MPNSKEEKVTNHRNFMVRKSLDSSYLDLELDIRTTDGIGTSKPVSIKTVLIYLVSMFALFFLLFRTFLVNSGFLIKFLFFIFWGILTFFLATKDNTGRTGIELINPLIDYFSKLNRFIPTRKNDSISKMRFITNIKDVDSSGLIYYEDGTKGFGYFVIGSASALMFEDDKRFVTNDNSSFNASIEVGVEAMFDTLKEPQKITNQVNNINQRRKNLRSEDPDLFKVLDEQYFVMTEGVGEKFKSIHQYMFVKAENDELLEKFDRDIEIRTQHQLMFKYIRTLTYDEVVDYMDSKFSSLKLEK